MSEHESTIEMQSIHDLASVKQHEQTCAAQDRRRTTLRERLKAIKERQVQSAKKD